MVQGSSRSTDFLSVSVSQPPKALIPSRTDVRQVPTYEYHTFATYYLRTYIPARYLRYLTITPKLGCLKNNHTLQADSWDSGEPKRR